VQGKGSLFIAALAIAGMEGEWHLAGASTHLAGISHWSRGQKPEQMHSE